MDKLSISIIIPHQKKRLKWLAETLQSIKEQTREPLEVIEMTGKGTVHERINKGVEKAQGKYILLLCDDDKLTPTFLEKTYEVAEHTQADIVSTFIDTFGEEVGRHGPGLHPFFSSLFRKSMFNTVGGFDGNMLQMADVDFWYRCLQSGARWEKLCEPTYLYRKHGNQDSGTADWSIAREAFKKKHGFIW